MWILLFLIPIMGELVIPFILDLVVFQRRPDEDFSSHCDKLGAESNEAMVIG